MTNHGTVPAELSQSELREFHSAVLQQLPDILPDEVRYFIRHKGELGKRLREVLAPIVRSTDSGSRRSGRVVRREMHWHPGEFFP